MTYTHRMCLSSSLDNLWEGYLLHIKYHPVFGKDERKEIEFFFEGKKYTAKKGQKIAAALMMNNIYEFSKSRKLNQPKSAFCNMGRCMNCYVTVEDTNNVRACQKEITEDMNIYKQSFD